MEWIVALIVGIVFIIAFGIIGFVYLDGAIDKDAKDRKERERIFFEELEKERRLKNKLKAYRPPKI